MMNTPKDSAKRGLKLNKSIYYKLVIIESD